ncbi:MAG: GyrI-like domain-containing protein [Firmicutes bacterium]|nr:GyrI-like domain-containing protein [Bacillota bacterium]
MKKHVKSFMALVATKELTIGEIFKFSQEIYPKMMEEIHTNNLEVTDNIVFVSYGRDGNMNKKFKHQICIPIKQGTNYSGEFEIKQIEEFDCLADIFTGTINQILTEGINKLLSDASKSKLKLSNEMREVYHNWQKPRSKKNVVEIQFGLQES